MKDAKDQNEATRRLMARNHE